ATEGYVKFGAVALTPPLMIGFVALSEPEMTHGLGHDGATLIGMVFVGLFIWSGVGALFYHLAYNSFQDRVLQHAGAVKLKPTAPQVDNPLMPLLEGTVIALPEAQETERPGDIDRHVR